jgi:hypothetical protein
LEIANGGSSEPPHAETKKLVIIQTRRFGGQIGIHIKRMLFYLIKGWSISPKEDCVFEFCYDGPGKDIPTRKKERTEFLAPYVEALCGRLSQFPHDPIDLELLKVNLRDLKSMEKTRRDAYYERLKLIKSGVVSLGKLPCEVFTGSTYPIGTYWGTLPIFQRVGVQKVWTASDIMSCLYTPDVAVDVSRTLYRATCDLGIPTKIDHKLIIPSFWVDYADAKGEKRALQQAGL